MSCFELAQHSADCNVAWEVDVSCSLVVADRSNEVLQYTVVCLERLDFRLQCRNLYLSSALTGVYHQCKIRRGACDDGYDVSW